MDFNSELENYVLTHTSQEEDVLLNLNRETHLKVINPRMLSGHLQGKILEMFSKMIKPDHILEIGMFTGYSAICLAKGLSVNGKLHTIEINDELEEIARKYFKKAGVDQMIEIHLGNAINIIPELNIPFDLVYIDGEKKEYGKYYELIIDKMKSGSFIIADNVLWKGKVVELPEIQDAATNAINKFNNVVLNDNRVEIVLLPIRDGLMLIRKK